MVYCHQQYYNPDHTDDKFENYGKVPILSDTEHELLNSQICGLCLQYSETSVFTCLYH